MTLRAADTAKPVVKNRLGHKAQAGHSPGAAQGRLDLSVQAATKRGAVVARSGAEIAIGTLVDELPDPLIRRTGDIGALTS